MIFSEEFLMLTNEASYSVHIPAISAFFSEEAQAVQLHCPSGRLPYKLLTLLVSRLGPGCGGAWGQWGGGRCITTHRVPAAELGCNPKHLVWVPGMQGQPCLVGEPGSGHRGLIRVAKTSRTDPILLCNWVFWSEGAPLLL